MQIFVKEYSILLLEILYYIPFLIFSKMDLHFTR